MASKPFISLIMPNYNNEHVLDLFFSKLIENNTYDNYELIVADDGSVDNSLVILKKWQNLKKIKNFTIFENKHKGIVYALNDCLRAAKGEYIIRLDGDATIETKSFIEKFLDFYNIAPQKIGVITAKVTFDDGRLHAIGRNVISEKGLHNRGYDILEKIGNREFDYNIKIDNKLSDYLNIPAECDTALGVCTFSDRNTALKIGGFCSNYPLWIEDDDFYLGYRLHGKKCFYLPAIEVCHRISLRGKRSPKNFNLINYIKNKFLVIIRIMFMFCQIYDFPLLLPNIYKLKTNLGKNKWRINILKQDYKYWEQKWGFDCLNPNLSKIKDKYKNTEIIWNYDETLKQQGINIINEYLKKYSKN